MASDVKSPGTKANDIPDQAISESDNGPRNYQDIPEGAISPEFVRERFQIMQTYWSGIHEAGNQDDKFVAGEHWPEEIKKERQEKRRPVLTYNMVPSFNRQITNRMRQERAAIKVSPVETNRGADPRMGNVVGTKDYSMADVYAGIIKNIEHVSRADQAYDTAGKHAVDHGFGYFYMMPQWSKIDPFNQELVIHRVKNSYSILLDPDALEADYRDMQDAIMFTDITTATFDKKYPGVPHTEFSGVSLGETYKNWYQSNKVRVAQYLWLDHRNDEALMLSNDKVVYFNDVKDVLDELDEEFGIHIMKNGSGEEMRKKVKRPVCCWQKMTADVVLEGPIDLPFSSVPIYPVLGEEVMVEGETRYESAHRHAQDAQRSYNYWRTEAAETVALAPRAPYMATQRQLEGHEHLFETANTENHPVLTYNHQEGVAPPQRQFPANPAAAELANAGQDAADMQAIIGLHDASLGKEGNEKSGKAILARQSAGTTSTFQFPDNQTRAIEQMGRNAVEAIPRLYDTRRIIRIRLPDGNDDFIEINQAIKDNESGNEILVHDIAYGKYDVIADTGPSYATQRQEAADLQMELLKVLGPDRAANIVHLIVENLGVPGSDQVASVLRKMLPDALKSEDEKMADLPKGVRKNPETGQLEDENGEPYQPPMTLEMQIQQKTNEIEEMKAKAELDAAAAKSADAQAKLKQAEAKIKEAEAKLSELQNLGENAQAIDGMMPKIQEIIENAMKEHSDNADAHQALDIEGKITDAVVDALQRVRGYIDRQQQAGALAPADQYEDTREIEPKTDKPPKDQAPSVVLKLGNVVQEREKPSKVVITPQDDGTVIAVPEFNNDDKED